MSGARAQAGRPDEVSELVDHLFRHAYGKLVAVLTARYGLSQLQQAEDIVQETLVAALHHWSMRGIPDRPEAWLMQVAKNRAINVLKQDRNRALLRAQHSSALEPESSASTEVFLQSDIEDSQLRMVFACCHPEIAAEDQLALVLKSLCGFSSREIARALLVGQEAIDKRLYRARARIRSEGVTLEVPGGDELPARLQMVCLSLYVLFSEGYDSTESTDPIRVELCEEAMRLTALCCGRFVDEPALQALLALMHLQAARFGARLDEAGAPVLLEAQDRSLWDGRLIARGMQLLAASARGDELSRHHLEASIAAQHCLAPSFEQTDWPLILSFYDVLCARGDNPLFSLNRAIVLGYAQEAAAAVEALQRLSGQPKLARRPALHAALGEFHQKCGELENAREAFQRALGLARSSRDRAFFTARLAQLQKSHPGH